MLHWLISSKESFISFVRHLRVFHSDFEAHCQTKQLKRLTMQNFSVYDMDFSCMLTLVLFLR